MRTTQWQIKVIPSLSLHDFDIIDDLQHAGGCGVKAENDRLLHN